jgi:hypothetical protein
MLRQKAGNFRLVSHRPGQRTLVRVLLLCAIVGSGGLGYWYGWAHSSLDADYLQALIRRDRAGETQVADLRRELVDAELARTVDQQAAESLRETITALREEIADLREEAAMFRNMLDPGSAGQGVRIAEFELAPAHGDRRYHYHLLLSKLDTTGDLVRGVIAVEVRGVSIDGGRARERFIALGDLAGLEEYPIPFRFRYFHAISGLLELPVGFEPLGLRVRVLPAGGGRELLRGEFEWTVGTL